MKRISPIISVLSIGLSGLFTTTAAADNVFEAPACMGWKLQCSSHAPDWGITVEASGARMGFLAGPQANIPVNVPSSLTVTGQSGNQTFFSMDQGVSGFITTLPHPTCSDGHFFDNASFSIELDGGIQNSTMQRGNIACCVLVPY
jgi:hypothetical protein